MYAPRWRAFLSILLLLATLGAFARSSEQVCGTGAGGSREEIFLHRRHTELRRQARSSSPGAAAAADPVRTATSVSGDIVLMDDQDGTVGRRNPFSLDSRTVAFRPVGANAARYTFATSADSYDDAAASAGARVTLTDDDTTVVALPFSFPFFGKSYSRLFLNSDGNVTFDAGDKGQDRGFGRFASGAPRIAALFTDLDPSVTSDPAGVRVTVEAARLVVSWVAVPEYSSFGFAQPQTFQLRLFPDGRIEIAFHGIGAQDAVTGVSPGVIGVPATLVSIAAGSTAEYAGAVGERFASSAALDTVTIAQRFYESQQDAYDYLVIYNTLGIAPLVGAVAQETTVRNDRSGYGDTLVSDGAVFGSKQRLQAVLNMGSTSQYPLDPNALVPARGTTGDTPLSILGHEAGHLFLAFVSVKDPVDPNARPMLGRSNVHWSFFYNSEASLLEGNRIGDFLPASPRFATTGTVQQYSPLDQYLMGFRAPEDVPDSFYVASPTAGGGNGRAPQFGISFDGIKRTARTQDVIAIAGRRTPDSTVAQRSFRFAFILIYAKGAPPGADQIAQIDRYRAAFPDYYARVTGSRATAETTLRRAVQFSGRPAMGAVQNQASRAMLTIPSPAEKDLVFTVQTPLRVVGAPATVTIPAGQTQIAFDITGAKSGVEEMVLLPNDARYETVRSRVNVQPFAFFLKPIVLSGDRQTNSAPFPLPLPVVVKATDINGLPYAGIRIAATASTGGSVEPAAGAVTDENGLARFTWTPAPGAGNQLTAMLSGVPGTEVVATAADAPVIADGGIVNGASFASALAPATFAAMFGASLAAGVTDSAAAPFPSSLSGVRVLVNGKPAPVVSVFDRQINFVIPADTPAGPAGISVSTPLGASSTARVVLGVAAPAVFFGDGNLGAVRIAGTAKTTADQPATAGDFLEIYATGLNGAMPEVTIGGVAATVSYAGPFGLGAGFDQINVLVPDGLAAGDQPLVVKAAGATSNPVTIKVQ